MGGIIEKGQVSTKSLQRNNLLDGETRTGLIAPFKDMKRNFDDMNKTNVIGGDKYFHCKGNYQASSRGMYGKAVSMGLSGAKEAKDIFKYGFKDSQEDWEANQDGWNGAKNRLTLDEACGKRRPNLLKNRY